MNKSFILSLFFAFCLCKTVFSASDAMKPMQYKFSFDGIFGSLDKNSAQRGLQVFTEICSSCHGLDHLAYRNLEEIGYNKTQINNFASQFQINAAPDENGDINKRNAIYSDKFVNPYPNVKAAKASNNGAYPPDLTLIIKARKDGANYLRSLLLGYEEAPEGFDVGEGYYNKYMAGKIIAMPQPLYGDDVEYQDGTKATLEQEVLDVVTFLTWASMPELENRKSAGIKVIIFLIIMTLFFFLSYKKIWKDVK